MITSRLFKYWLDAFIPRRDHWSTAGPEFRILDQYIDLNMKPIHFIALCGFTDLVKFTLQRQIDYETIDVGDGRFSITLPCLRQRL
jgi:hypothetical protein